MNQCERYDEEKGAMNSFQLGLDSCRGFTIQITWSVFSEPFVVLSGRVNGVLLSRYEYYFAIVKEATKPNWPLFAG